jgi:hypothetical protein
MRSSTNSFGKKSGKAEVFYTDKQEKYLDVIDLMHYVFNTGDKLCAAHHLISEVTI